MKNILINRDSEPDNLFNEDIEEDILNLESEHSQQNILHLITTLKNSIENQKMLFVPVLEEYEGDDKDLFSLEKLNIKQLIEPNREVVGIPRKVELFNGGLAYTAFTSRKELDKGQATKFTSADMKEFFEMALESEDAVGIVLNPWDVSVLLDKKLLTMILAQNGILHHKGSLFVDQADLMKQKTDAIVTNITTDLIPVGSLSEAIYQRGGVKLKEALGKYTSLKPSEPVLTKAYRLPASYLISIPGPVYSGMEEDDKILAECYTRCLDLAMEHDLHSIAFPALSTGECGYPVDQSAAVAIMTASKWITDHPNYEIEIDLICYDDKTYNTYLDFIRSGQLDIEA